ncbi:MAG: hypothetical protein ACYS19_19225, partial [Planctomycetota bacterium]
DYFLAIADDLTDKEAKAQIKELKKLCHSIIKPSSAVVIESHRLLLIFQFKAPIGAPGRAQTIPKHPHFHASAPTTDIQPESPLSTNSAKTHTS